MKHFRFVRLVLHLLAGLFTVLCVWPFLKQPARVRSVQRFSKQLLRIVNVRVQLVGAEHLQPQGPSVLYSNHVSWLDPFVINSVHPAIFIAKSELETWPVAGTLAKRAGVLFIERGKRHAVRDVIAAATKVLQAGGSVAMFPEGTTGTGEAPMHFHSNFVQPAIHAAVPLLPVSLQFFDPQGHFTTQPAFFQGQALMDNVRVLLSQREGFEVCLTVHAPFSVEGRTRHELSQQAFEAIARSMVQDHLKNT